VIFHVKQDEQKEKEVEKKFISEMNKYITYNEKKTRAK